ncbi:MAG: hypothetical protein QGI21_04060 [Candidatus Poseidoniaceae archaeon]|jgi:dihydrofolate synthase/folylpolyglutamate synthase|nr:hypothetical protein [Candidatus Poseidoniaceae archaeon]
MTEVTPREWLEATKSHGMQLGLERVNEALEALGRPDKQMSCIQVAGSNGKGSACSQLVAGLCQAGYNVGLFSSPHIARIEERIRVNGKPIDSESFDKALMLIKELEIQLTFFEITYIASLIICSNNEMQIMILETGLGGRYDATSSAEVIGCLVTSISFEHSDILGETLEDIAREKAAIWRPGVPMLVRDPCIPRIRNAIREEAISARFWNPESGNAMDEAGDLAEVLCKMLGLEFERRMPKWPARMQYVEGTPSILLDAAHNPSGMLRIIPEISEKLPKKWSLLFGTSPQIDMKLFLQPLFELMIENPPQEIITTEPQGGRYAGVVQPISEVVHISNPEEAIQAFRLECDMILIVGSLYLCGNILTYLGLDTDEDLDILS